MKKCKLLPFYRRVGRNIKLNHRDFLSEDEGRVYDFF